MKPEAVQTIDRRLAGIPAVLWPFLAVITLFLIFTLSLLWAIWPIDLVSLANGGLAGDSYGALNALFSGLGFAGVLAALFYQQRQLKIQQEELNSTQVELRRQSSLFERQQFDESFFAMLALMHQSLTSLYHRNAKTREEVRGLDLLTLRLANLRTGIKEERLGAFPLSEDERVLYTWSLWKLVVNRLGRQTRYVDTVGCLVSWISTRCPADCDPTTYWDLVAAQLTVYEIQYLAYQVLISHEGHPLRLHLTNHNALQAALLGAGINSEHRKALHWLMGLPGNPVARANGYKSPINLKIVARAKRRISSSRAAPATTIA